MREEEASKLGAHTPLLSKATGGPSTTNHLRAVPCRRAVQRVQLLVLSCRALLPCTYVLLTSTRLKLEREEKKKRGCGECCFPPPLAPTPFPASFQPSAFPLPSAAARTALGWKLEGRIRSGGVGWARVGLGQGSGGLQAPSGN